MVEVHPFGIFTPKKCQYLLLGSFTSWNRGETKIYDWFYGTKVNQFWPILREVYGRDLNSREEKQQLFSDIGLAITDIILQCERLKGNSLDTNLINIVYNSEAIEKVLNENEIKKIYFSSRYVEDKFKKVFKYLVDKYPEVELVTLPSPSPRYAQITKAEKVKLYKKLLPYL